MTMLFLFWLLIALGLTASCCLFQAFKFREQALAERAYRTMLQDEMSAERKLYAELRDKAREDRSELIARSAALRRELEDLREKLVHESVPAHRDPVTGRFVKSAPAFRLSKYEVARGPIEMVARRKSAVAG